MPQGGGSETELCKDAGSGQWRSHGRVRGRRRATVCRIRLEPAALCGNKNGLGAVDCAELAVRVVEVRAHRARRKVELERDLLVNLALGEALQHLDLAGRERTRLDLARRALAGVRKLVHDAA